MSSAQIFQEIDNNCAHDEWSALTTATDLAAFNVLSYNIIHMKTAGLLATRRSLVDRLANWDDQRRWQDFFDTYWKLIYSAARKSGLSDAEAQEVVQETVITVAKKIDKLRYDPALGSFKG